MGTLSLAIAYRQKYQQQYATGQKLGLQEKQQYSNQQDPRIKDT